MKTLCHLFYLVFRKDYKYRLSCAKALTRTIDGSTYGRPSHFYDGNGEQIRGWAQKQYRFKNELTELELKYK